ncbi:MAG: SH3 domain-containing protein, partial [Planctomycetaceae bacterium]|nr:SH3 domain-containing protein [Planctomycetaceae bacterium]
MFFVALQQPLVFAANPIVASIIVSKTEVRSGPDLSFYPTSTLKLGDEVEIYFESNNWFAIRPPLGSFSWVGAGHVSLTEGNVGVVLTQGLASRVGSEIVDSCETVQVKLKRGEKILVLDKKETPQNTASPIWFKISPPSGEYRWIPRGAIDPNFRNDKNLYANSQSKITTAEYLTKPSNLQDYRLVLYEESKPETNSTTPVNSSLPPLVPPSATESELNNSTSANTIGLAANDAARRVVNNSTNPTAISEPYASTGLRFEDSKGSADSPTLVASAVNSTSGRYAKGANWSFQRVFDELQSETVAALTGQTDDWVFVTLIEEANRLYNSASTDAEMEKVYHIAESLKRGRAVRQDIVNKRQINRNINNNN